ncbi:reverse transcriptase domain-containing protein [Rhizobium sp. Leaf306]|uniref:reverse transcriptase domain-containing protein n=1 Tax=Rhizobium sp. Leaf306 TaxID=1736330 RepID=UPI000785AC3D|nr:reverse transcriptase domain-containing protein [Rhizobium sp. Leaf306]
MTYAPRYHFTHYATDHPDFVAEVLGHGNRRDAALRQIAHAPNRDKQRLLILRFLGHTNFKLLYLLRSVQAKRRLRTHPPEAMRELAARMTATYHFAEYVRTTTVQPAPHKRRRTTFDFGPGKHALQTMVADVIRAMFPLPSGRHFTLEGGVKAALMAVNEHAQHGFIHGIERDIDQFYPSVDLQGLATLLRPLPGSVVRNVIGYRHGDTGLTAMHSTEAIDDAPLPPRGMLAQGSAASPAAAELLVADLLEAMPGDVRVMSYADNILILGETISSIETADAILVGRASEHQCGPLGLKPRKECLITGPSGINFLGHDGYWNGSRIQWMPDTAATNHILQAIELSTNEREGALDQVRNAIQRLRHWQRGYVWEDGQEETERFSAQLWAKLAFNAPHLSREYILAIRSVTNYFQRHHSRHGEYPDLADLLPDFADANERRGKRPAFIRDIENRLGIPLRPSETEA